MSLLPYLLDCELRPRRIREQLFGLDLSPGDFITDLLERPSSKYLRPWQNLSSLTQDVGSTLKIDKDKFQINLDVQHFAPEEVTVKIIDNFIVVEGDHEEKKDAHGFISRQFKRRYALPEDFNPDGIESKLSSDGVLTITAPKKALTGDERTIPISQTGPIRRKIQDVQEQQIDDAEIKSCQKKKRR